MERIGFFGRLRERFRMEWKKQSAGEGGQPACREGEKFRP